MVSEIQKILNFAETIREWLLVPSSFQNLHKISLSHVVIKK